VLQADTTVCFIVGLAMMMRFVSARPYREVWIDMDEGGATAMSPDR
jgi:hypothetical protein